PRSAAHLVPGGGGIVLRGDIQGTPGPNIDVGPSGLPGDLDPSSGSRIGLAIQVDRDGLVTGVELNHADKAVDCAVGLDVIAIAKDLRVLCTAARARLELTDLAPVSRVAGVVLRFDIQARRAADVLKHAAVGQQNSIARGDILRVCPARAG